LELAPKLLKGVVGKVMEDQTANAGIGVELGEALEEIAGDPLDFIRQIFRTRR
jgi:hypothetical protein